MPKHSFWQISLSTTIVLTFVAAGLVAANVNADRLHPEEKQLLTEIYGPQLPPPEIRGWPFIMYPTFFPPAPMIMQKWDSANIALDLAVALVALTIATFVCEWLVRRRSAGASPET